MAESEAKEIKLKNFVYADWNVILSLYSQLNEGISEYTMSERSKEMEAGLEASGGLPFLKGKGYAGGSTADVETEKFLRHHDLYNQLERDLLDYRLVTVVTPDYDFSKWGDFKDSDYLFIRPQLIRFANYSEMLSLFQTSLPYIQGKQDNTRRDELTQELSELKSRHAEPTRQQAIKKELAGLDAESNQGLTEESLDIIAEFLGTRFKVMPNKNNNDKYFVCNCDPSLFTGSLDFLKNQFGLSVEGPWVVFGQVNVPVLDSTDFTVTENQLDSIFDQFFTATQGEMFNFSGVTYPAISVSPICIYRETTGLISKP